MSNINIGAVIDIAKVVKDALGTEAKKSTNDIKPSDAEKIAPAVSAKVEAAVNKEVAAVVEHATNSEPWYRSRVLIGLFISLLLKGAAALGWATDTIDPDSVTTAVLALGSAVGDLLALYGRTVATKAIGR